MAANSFSIDLGQRFIKMAEVDLNKNNFSAKSLIVQQMPNDIYNAQTEKDFTAKTDNLSLFVSISELS